MARLVTDSAVVQSSPDLTCLTTDVFADFYFYTEPKDSPPMCSEMRVTWNDNATYPMGLHGLIPGGSAWDIPIPQTRATPTANWTVDIAHGTRFVLLMSDAGVYGTGGSTIPLTVQYSTNSSCLTADSPRTTVASTSSSSPTPTSSPSSSSSSSSSPSGGSKSNAGAIAGGVVGGIVGLLILLAALWLCMRRRKRNDSEAGRPMGERREGSRLLGRRNKARTSGHSGGGRQSGFEIDVFEGQHPDSTSANGEHSDSGDDHIQPYPYTHAPVGVPLRDSVLSTDTDGSRNSRVSFAGMGAGVGASSSTAGQFGDKEILAAALSTHGSTVQGSPSAHSRNSSVALSQGQRTNAGNNPDLYTVSELALASAASGRPVDREELLAIIDPPPKYKQYDALRANNPDANLNNPDAEDPVVPTETDTTTASSSRRSPRPSNEERSER